MNNNEIIMLIIAFVVGFMIRELMKIVCRSRLVEGAVGCDVQKCGPLTTDHGYLNIDQCNNLRNTDECSGCDVGWMNGGPNTPFKGCTLCDQYGMKTMEGESGHTLCDA